MAETTKRTVQARKGSRYYLLAIDPEGGPFVVNATAPYKSYNSLVRFARDYLSKVSNLGYADPTLYYIVHTGVQKVECGAFTTYDLDDVWEIMERGRKTRKELDK